MNQAGTIKNQKKSLRETQRQADRATQGTQTIATVIYEGNFLKNAVAKAKDFLKSKSADVKRFGSKIVKDIKQKYSTKKKPTNFMPGKMISFQYNAKDATKKFDKNPLVISLGYSQNPKYSKKNFYGLNLHWMPMKSRIATASFFTELNKKRNNKLRYSDVAPFISKFKGNKVLRQYIIKNVSNKVVEMPEDIFMSAAGVPSEKWSK